MSNLTTLASVKSWLNLTGTADDALLTALVPSVSAAIDKYLSRSLATAAYTEVRDGTGGARLSFANYPVTAVASVKIDEAVIPAATSAIGAGYVFSQTSIVLRGYLFTLGLQNVQLAYTAGYASTPADIEQACIDWIGHIYRSRDRIGHQSKSIQGETVSFFIGPMPKFVEQVLKPFRKVAPC